MAFSAGTFSLYSPGNPVVTGTTIASTWANNTLNDIASGLSTCVLKDGSQTITANIPMAGFKFTGLGAGSAAGNSLRYEQIFSSGTTVIGSVAGWTLISTASAAVSATVDLTTGISSTYDRYVLLIDSLIPATNATNLLLRVSQDSGATFKAGATDYSYGQNLTDSAGANTPTGAATTAIVLATSLSSGATGAFQARIEFSSPASTAIQKTFMFDCSGSSSTQVANRWVGSGTFNLNTAAVNAIRILMTAGNITSGNFALYGVRKA